MDVVDIFPVAIAVTELESLTPDLVHEAIELIEHGSKTEDIPTDGEYTNEQQLLDNTLFTRVREEIISNCLEFSRAYSHQVEGIRICNSWGNIVGTGQSIRFHKHINSYISGSFYLTEGSPFIFHNFAGEDLFSVSPAIIAEEENYRAEQSFVINPKPARLILFPSGLHHSVHNSQELEKRYSIAFNTMPVGKIGTPTNLVEYN